MTFHAGSGTMDRFYRTYSGFLREKFKKEISKISIATHATCPNRDGTLSYGGCIYCSESGSGRVTADSPAEQVADYLNRRSNQSKGYIAYFQSYSNMYKEGAGIKQELKKIALMKSIVGFSVATRPDCIDCGTMDYLKSLSETHFIQIELGLETANEKTLESINRKMKSSDYLDACREVKKRIPGCHIVCHVIIGLPGESMKDFEATLALFNESSAEGIKFHHLYVPKKAPLEKLFREGKIELMAEDDYIENLLALLARVPSDRVIHRMKSSSSSMDLVAPLWTLNPYFREKLSKRAGELKIFQGSFYGDNAFNCWKKAL